MDRFDTSLDRQALMILIDQTCLKPKRNQIRVHGIKRSRIPPVRDSEEIARKKAEKEAAKVEEYRSILTKVITASAKKDYSIEALELTSKILALNPEFSTGWSYRRRILSRGLFIEASQETIQSLLTTDLSLTIQALKMNPKNYSVWEHRKWVLQEMPKANWDQEMMLVEAYLAKDGRNFHTWNYRRYCIAAMLAAPIKSNVTIISLDPEKPEEPSRPRPTTTSELLYTTKSISKNFSNFSAWHYRTKLLPKLFVEQGWSSDSFERRARVDQEFDLVKQAIWSDPNDQSAWLYHRWLLNEAGNGTIELIRREILGVEELLEEEPDSRLCIDSLVYYKGLLRKGLARDAEQNRVEMDELVSNCTLMLQKLASLDPMKKGRYQDLIKDLSVSVA